MYIQHIAKLTDWYVVKTINFTMLATLRSLAVVVKSYMVGFKIHRSCGEPFPSVELKLSPNYAIKCILTTAWPSATATKQ